LATKWLYLMALRCSPRLFPSLKHQSARTKMSQVLEKEIPA
jgi:hypothetical protein